MTLIPIRGIGEIATGADVAGLILEALRGDELTLRDGDIVAVSSKILAKAAGLRAPLSQRAVMVLQESRRVVAERITPGGITRIVQSRAGPVLAAAGVDVSNTGPEPGLLLLPPDPDHAAAALRTALMTRSAEAQPAPSIGVIVTDTAGRPWRSGQTDFALGAAGLLVLEDLRDTVDDDGRALHVTARAVADELAAAADLVKGKTTRTAAVLVRGLDHLVSSNVPPHVAPNPSGPTQSPTGRADDGPIDSATHNAAHNRTFSGAATLLRDGTEDWFALGHVEAVRAALGVTPGTQEAVDVGIPTAGEEDPQHRIARACRLALIPHSLGRVPAGHPREHLVRCTIDLSTVSMHTVQSGVRVFAPDDLTLGIAVGRLLPALAAEGIDATLAEVTQRPSSAASALVLFL